ncbi:CIN4 (YMR138W) [Zygosaccharomyces parabailii]|uniref:BN860_10858g1_1 n=1 Tax=Zygosaccharomyces bailii (strain CLIB 213 / ATCC 58445 / CBS 680 / BCRC 21525 / NBRC 1098 / NCYC 1416 / NRRL Y-2227) TaxID=1333698 RepID=A0A8J2T5N8_ZYGB2|nr:CIN4 (YMR138W) [Zygosaccharomyces parabailii]CDF88463.1 BN860_10858g1_1 [Zygosaccharomyces bailii CLIB 213]CDH14656.1 related to GTP-binding protein CIN4 [Zygosaccharomyces bailii ISA1307]
MGLLTLVKKQKIKDHEIRCLILGLDNAGKSTIVNQILPMDQRQQHVSPTIGFAIHNVEMGPFNVSLWDVGGQTTLRPFWDNYYDRTDVLVWCIDVSSPGRLAESLQEAKPFLKGDSRVIVALNKCDLVPSRQDTDKVLEQVQRLMGPVQFVACSGRTGKGLRELCSAIASCNI